MLLHEWMRYREKHIKRPELEADSEQERTAAVETLPPPAEEVQAEELEGEPLAEAQQPPSAEAQAEAAPEPREVPVSTRAVRPVALPRGEDGEAPTFQTQRLRALLARQRQLPLEVTEPSDAGGGRRREAAKESREDLVQRLLDPVLSISETATLLGVCSTSVRRYTKRGLLKCFRTPGNQRRFRLADVLDFMERQQSGE